VPSARSISSFGLVIAMFLVGTDVANAGCERADIDGSRRGTVEFTFSDFAAREHEADPRSVEVRLRSNGSRVYVKGIRTDFTTGRRAFAHPRRPCCEL